MEGDDRAVGTHDAGDGIIHVVGAVVIGRACPHAGVGVVFHILAQLAERLAGYGFGHGIAGAVHDDIQVMHAPVNQRAAARDGVGGKRAAQAGDGAVSAEGDIHMVNLAQLARVDDLLDFVDGVVKAVDHADVEGFSALVLGLLHFQRLGIGAGGGLFAQHMLARPERVDGDDGVHSVGRTDGYGFHLGIVENVVIVGYRLAAAVFFHGSLGTLGDDIAEILDFGVLVGHVGRDVGIVGNASAANNAYFDGFHNRQTSFIMYGC